MKVWKIPQHDEMPSEEMIAWLHEMTQEWDGDESGITICSLDGEHKVGGPGDFVVEDGGIYRIMSGDEILEEYGYQP